MSTLGITWVPAGGGGSGKAAAAPDLRAISDEVKRSVVQWHRARKSRAQGGTSGGKHLSHSSHGQHQGQGICHRRASLENGAKGGGNQKRVIKTFEERIEELTAYKAEHGHVNVKPSEDYSLANFCANTRKARRGRGNTKLTEERIASLDALGFNWAPDANGGRSSDAFEKRVEELRAYKATQGHLNAKRSADKSLYNFCRDMRYARRYPDSSKGRKLTVERIASLDALGFDWTPNNEKADSFRERAQELTAYKAEHGNVNVKEGEDKSLHQFCVHIRQAREGRGNMKMTEDRIASLDALGFKW